MSTQDSDVRSRIGGGIGSAIGARIVQATLSARREAAPLQASVGERIFTGITNHVSDEVRSVMGPLFREAAEHPDTPDEARPLLRALGNRRGQAWAWIGGTATGAALGGGLMNLLTNYLNPAILPLIAAKPNGILSPSDVAALAARSMGSDLNLTKEAAYSGLSGQRFGRLVELARTRPGLAELHAMLNRGDITESQAGQQVMFAGFPPSLVPDLLNLRHADVSAPDLAAMWNRNIISDGELVSLGRRQGYSDLEMRRFADLGGEPPAVQELLLAWRRGKLTESQVDRALIQGPLRKEWIGVIKQLQWEPLSPDVAADAVNQGHMSLAAARAAARESGVLPDHFDLIVENAGLPPGLEFAEEAFNRGVITDAEWERMFLESRIKNRYIPLMREMRTRLVPQETIRLLYREGVYTEAQAIDGMRSHGFSATDARALIELEVARRTEGTKDLTRAQIIDLFEDEIIDADQASNMLRGQGYSDAEVQWQVMIAEVNKMRRFVNAATTRIRNAYVGGHIDEGEATDRLNGIGLSPRQIDNLMSIWDIERETLVAQLTPTQILTAAKKEIITWDDAYQRLIGRGYSPVDAAILVASNDGELTTGPGGTG
jgi:hypothetical protein